MHEQARRRAPGVWEDEILPLAASIVGSYDTGVTLRQLFYRLVSDGVLGNTRAEYGQLSSRTAAARRAGTFPELLDRTRQIIVRASWDSPEQARRALRNLYRRDRTEGQEWSIYLGIEKAGIIEQLRAWFGDDYGLPILPLGGYHSETFERKIDTHAGGYDRPSVLLYAGDLDPSGEDIERNFLRWTDFDKTEKVALSREQAVEYDLPAMVGKASDSRAGAFIEKYGELFQIEVDAIPPDELRRLFADALSRYWDPDALQAVLEQEEADRREL